VPYEDPANPLTVYAAGGNFHAAAMKLNRKTNAWEPFLDGAPVDCVSYSPDGQWIAYVSWPGGELWKCRRDGSGKVLLDAGLRAYNPSWSADGQRIIFSARTREVGATPPPLETYSIAAVGGKPERLPRVAWPNGDATWAPDGRRMAFGLSDEEAIRKAENPISILNQETGKVEAVPGSKNLFAPHWSPDGKLLEATSFDKHSLYVYSFAAQNWRLLRAGDIGFSRWSKDSRYIYCARGPEVKAILRVEVATGKAQEIRRLTEFDVTAVYWPGVYWTPEEEPVVLRSLASTQIYRIERDR
jgi:dipeptidyl aminopeptidase/acylaminoacyl peptidase